ncbi:UPF0394 membrane protein [Paramyrothecium foliicola]|nr:UPF0394 membrane protein [Paramyrothecium foliicola]
MDLTTAATLLRGAIFGTGLTLSGVAGPQVIRDQFRLVNFHMLITFLTASASSAAIFAGYNVLKSTKKPIPHRSDSSHGWLGDYDGNIIGGAMVGLGMTITGACPGTVLVQAVAGTENSRLLAGSALLAGVAWVKCKPWLIRPRTCQPERSPTVMAATGYTAEKIVVWYEVAMVAVIATTLIIAPRSATMLHPVVGGLLIGIGQLASVTLSNKPIGVSTVYEESGQLFWNAMEGKRSNKVPDSILFAGGLMTGSLLTMSALPATREALVSGTEPASTLMIAVGGLLLSFGARVAGGCTSGHGISGMATMSLSSIITVASMFGTALLSGLLLR